MSYNLIIEKVFLDRYRSGDSSGAVSVFRTSSAVPS